MENLVSFDELNARINDQSLVVVDTRDKASFAKAHIPNAVNIPEIFTYICLPENGDHQAMAEFFTKRLGEAGISSKDDVVFYEDAMDNGYGQSCRGWFLLKFLGHKGSLAVFNGGYRAWKANGLPLSSDYVQRKPVEYQSQVNSEVIVTKKEMLQAIGDESITIVDVRDYAEWIGANSSPYGYDYCPRKGRIPGAIWLEWYRLMTRKGGIPWFRTPEEIRQLGEQIGLSKDKTIFVYCFKGARTSNVMLALTMSGYKVRNYFNSWNEWSRDEEMPIEEDYPDNPMTAF